jgi:ATP-dependent Clp protease protease subunit
VYKRQQLKQYKGRDIVVWVDSYGGDVFAAVGMYNALQEHDGKITTKIDSKAMSAATLPFLAGNNRQISPAGIFMVHNPLIGIMGYYKSDDLQDMSKYLDAVKESIMNIYELATGKTRDEISKLMDDETYMSAQKAIDEGFADEMLYADKNVDITNNFAFNRMAIVNSARASMDKLISLQQKEKPKKKPKDDSVDIAKAKLKLQLTM